MNKNNNNTKVSIVIPTFNRANMVSKTIDSALAQTYPCEIVVCDHGSSDNTPDVIKKYGNKVKYIRREKDFGVHFCWMEGVLNATGDYVHIHYDDDLMMPNFIEKTLSMMAEDVGVAFGDGKWIDLRNNKSNDNVLNINKYFGSGTFDNKLLERAILEDGLMLSPAACLYRKKDILDSMYLYDLPIDFGGSYKGVGPDHLMTLTCLLRYNKFACTDEILTIFTAHDGSISADADTTNIKRKKIKAAYDAVRNYYLLLKHYKEDKSFLTTKKFVSLFEIKNSPEEGKIFYLLGVPFFKIVKSGLKTKYYLFGVKVYKKKA